MAVISEMLSRTLTLGIKNGTTATGEDKIKNYNYTHINLEATDEALHTTAVNIGSLMANDLKKVFCTEKNLLTSGTNGAN